MSKLVIANLPADITETAVRKLFKDFNLWHGEVVIKADGKRSHAFVDCLNQNNADRAIDKLNGLIAFGNIIRVGPI